MSEWIDIKEREPEIGSKILIATSDKEIRVGVKVADGGACWMEDGILSYLHEGDVTHWMPVPELPELEL
jgi:hypothetical protein